MILPACSIVACLAAVSQLLNVLAVASSVSLSHVDLPPWQGHGTLSAGSVTSFVQNSATSADTEPATGSVGSPLMMSGHCFMQTLHLPMRPPSPSPAVAVERLSLVPAVQGAGATGVQPAETDKEPSSYAGEKPCLCCVKQLAKDPSHRCLDLRRFNSN